MLRVFSFLIAVYLLSPTVLVAIMSFGDAGSFHFPPRSFGFAVYQSYFDSGPWLVATYNSVLIAILCSIAVLVLVVPAAMAQARYRYRGQEMLNTLLMLPIIVPPVVSAVAYYGFLSPLGLTSSILGMVIAHTALALPVTYLVVSASMKGFDLNLERAAMISGASRVRALFHVTFPVLRPGLLVGALFAFLYSFNESAVSIFIAGRNAETLPKRMFGSILTDTDPVIAVVSTLVTGATLLGAVIWLLAQSKTWRSAINWPMGTHAELDRPTVKAGGLV